MKHMYFIHLFNSYNLAYRQTKRDSARAHSADGNGEDASEREAEHARR